MPFHDGARSLEARHAFVTRACLALAISWLLLGAASGWAQVAAYDDAGSRRRHRRPRADGRGAEQANSCPVQRAEAARGRAPPRHPGGRADRARGRRGRRAHPAGPRPTIAAAERARPAGGGRQRPAAARPTRRTSAAAGPADRGAAAAARRPPALALLRPGSVTRHDAHARACRDHVPGSAAGAPPRCARRWRAAGRCRRRALASRATLRAQREPAYRPARTAGRRSRLRQRLASPQASGMPTASRTGAGAGRQARDLGDLVDTVGEQGCAARAPGGAARAGASARPPRR